MDMKDTGIMMDDEIIDDGHDGMNEFYDYF